MTDTVRIRVKAGQSLAAPDGRVIRAGETADVSAHEAAFFEQMGAAEIVATSEDGEPAKARAMAKAKAQGAE